MSVTIDRQRSSLRSSHQYIPSSEGAGKSVISAEKLLFGVDMDVGSCGALFACQDTYARHTCDMVHTSDRCDV